MAEGAETEKQREHLVRLGCDKAQGYYFNYIGQKSPSSLGGG
ncbi:hypothetical protein [Paenibacillus alkaliterrae]|nr:hypothetical protein [Paenibacillus alkaliterrae]